MSKKYLKLILDCLLLMMFHLIHHYQEKRRNNVIAKLRIPYDEYTYNIKKVIRNIDKILDIYKKMGIERKTNNAYSSHIDELRKLINELEAYRDRINYNWKEYNDEY